MSPLTRERLRDGSFTVLLDVTAQTAWRRVEAEAGERPLAREGRAFSRLYKQRQPLYHATADALCDAEYEVGEEPLLVPLARPAALAELPRPGGRAPPGADRRPQRAAGGRPPGRALRHRPPAAGRGGQDADGRPPGLDAPRRSRPGARRRRGRVRRRRGHRPGRVRGGHLPARRAVDRGSDNAGGDGRRCHRRQDRDRPAVSQELRRRLPPAGVGRHRPRRPGHPAGARVGLRVRGGDQDRAAARRSACGTSSRTGSRAGAPPISGSS